MSADALEEMADFKSAVQTVREKGAAEKAGGSAAEHSEEETAQWYAKNDPGSEGGAGWAAADFDDQSWKTMKLPTYWESAGLPDYDGTSSGFAAKWTCRKLGWKKPDTASGPD